MNRSQRSQWRSAVLALAGMSLLAFFSVAQAQGGSDASEITGEASVVIFDDFVSGRSEIRYFLRDLKGKERRLYFSNGAPQSFATGKPFKIRGRGRSDGGFEVESLTAMADGGETGGGGATAGAPVAAAETRKVLTLLVDFNDALVDNGSSNGISLQEAKDRMFNETKNVAHFFNTASLGTWTIPDDIDGDGNQEVYGPYKIDYNYMNSTCSPSGWVSAARAAFEAATGRSYTDYRHTLLIVPNYWDYPGSAGRSCSWGGVAQLGCGTTCWAIGADAKSIFHGVLIHELGHNFTLHHASTDTDNDGTINSEYGDSSDNMGGSRIWAKFNTVHAGEMGWHDPENYEFRTLVPSSGSLYEYDLLAMDEDVPEWSGLRAIKVQRDAGSDYYLSYRLAEGHYNGVPSSYRGQLNIHYGRGNNRSYFVKTLLPGETYNDPHNGLIIKAVSETTVDATKVMTIEICKDTCSALPAPSNLVATANGASAIDVAWTNNAGPVDGFTLQHSTDGSNWSAEYQGAQTSYADTGLAVASTHYYRVRAFSGADVSGWSSVANATTDAIPPVAGFTWASNYTEVTFTDTSTDDTNISSWYWSFGDGSTSTQQNPNHTYSGADTYNVTLTVTDEHGASDSFSDSVTVEEAPFTDHYAQSQVTAGGTVSGSLSDTRFDDDIAQSVTERESGGKPANRHTWLEHQWNFSVPLGAQATVIANAWQLDTGEGDHFDFQVSVNGGPWESMFTVDTQNQAESFAFILPSGSSGAISVRVLDTDQTRGNRSRDTVFVDQLKIRVENATGPPPDGVPGNLVATAQGHDQIALNWSDNSSNETGFRVERLDGASWILVGTVGENATAFTDTGLSALTVYTYRVKAYNLVDESAASGTASAETGEPPPQPGIVLTVQATKVKGKHAPTLNWTPAESMDVYFNQSSPAKVGTAVSSGFQHNTGNKRGGPYTYQVCEAGDTTRCSDWVTVSY